MPKRAPLATTLSSRCLSATCGPSISTFSASRNSAAPPTWSIWPWVSQIFSTVTPVCLIAAWIFGTSPPGSITTAFLLGSCQMMVQFCSNNVTGTMIAPAFALVSAVVSVSWVMPNQSICFQECGCAADPDQGRSGPRLGRAVLYRSAAPISEPCPRFGVASGNRFCRVVGQDGSGRQRLVAARYFLPDLPTLVSGLERRWGRRHQGDYRAIALSEGIGGRRRLAIADLCLADGGFRLRYLRLHRHRPLVWHDGGFR